MKDTDYLHFEDVTPDRRKTRMVLVRAVRSGEPLAMIRWYGPWRQYVLAPVTATVWNPRCLEAVQAVIAELMQERRERRAS